MKNLFLLAGVLVLMVIFWHELCALGIYLLCRMAPVMDDTDAGESTIADSQEGEARREPRPTGERFVAVDGGNGSWRVEDNEIREPKKRERYALCFHRYSAGQYAEMWAKAEADGLNRRDANEKYDAARIGGQARQQPRHTFQRGASPADW